MKNTTKILGIIALVAVIGFSMAACNGDDSAEETVTKTLEKARYLTADAAGNVYELVISQAEGRYVGQANDGYRLGIWTNGTEAKTSTGTVASVDNASGGGKRYGLKRGNATAFNVEVSDTWITSLPASIPVDTGSNASVSGSIVARGTLSNAENVFYNDTWGANNSTAKGITDFGYSEDNGSIVSLASQLTGTSVKVINGKISITLGDASSLGTPPLESIQTQGTMIVTTTPAGSVKVLRQEKPFFNEDGTYILACVKTATAGLLEYSMLCWAEKEFTMSGSAPVYGNNGWQFHDIWENCTAKKGWNYYIAKEVINGKDVTRTYSVPADSTQPPEGFRWTVISMDKVDILKPYSDDDQ